MFTRACVGVCAQGGGVLVQGRDELEKQNVFLKIVELKAGADINQGEHDRL